MRRDGEEYDAWEDDPDDDTLPSWYAGHHLPPEARKMGLSPSVPDGALLDFAGRLDARKPVHRFTAWAMLVVFGLPVLFAVMRLFYVF